MGAEAGFCPIALGGATGAVSWAIEGIVGATCIRAAAPGVVGVEGWVGSLRGGSVKKLVFSNSWSSGKSSNTGAGAGVGAGVGDGVWS